MNSLDAEKLLNQAPFLRIELSVFSHSDWGTLRCAVIFSVDNVPSIHSSTHYLLRVTGKLKPVHNVLLWNWKETSQINMYERFACNVKWYLKVMSEQSTGGMSRHQQKYATMWNHSDVWFPVSKKEDVNCFKITAWPSRTVTVYCIGSAIQIYKQNIIKLEKKFLTS